MREEMIEQKITGRFQSIYDWFAGREGQDSEAAKLFDVTKPPPWIMTVNTKRKDIHSHISLLRFRTVQ